MFPEGSTVKWSLVLSLAVSTLCEELSDMFKGDSPGNWLADTRVQLAGHSSNCFSTFLLRGNQDPHREELTLSWLKMRAVKVDTTVPRPPVIVHQGFWIRSPMKMA